jgi:hypothetical protein
VRKTGGNLHEDFLSRAEEFFSFNAPVFGLRAFCGNSYSEQGHTRRFRGGSPAQASGFR